MSSITALSRSYQPLTPGQEREQLLSFGLDEGTPGFVVTLNANLRDGAMAPTPATSPTSSAAPPNRWPPP
jgi:hypothetical protein